jgi:hypothetical protein
VGDTEAFKTAAIQIMNSIVTNSIAHLDSSCQDKTPKTIGGKEMSSVKVQNALSDFGQVDVLMEMVIKCLLINPENVKDKVWFEKLEHALYLLEATYKAKKAGLITALEGGQTNA